MELYLIFPFLSSVLYVVAALFIKRANTFEIGIWRSAFVTNVLTAVLFAGLWPMGGGPVVWAHMWQPLVVAALFVAGQVLTFVALERGDVSVVTPALGAKTVFVAWLSTAVLGEMLPWQLWVAAVLSFLSVVLLNQRKTHLRAATGVTILFALLAASAYATFDILVQKWSPDWGTGRFLPIMFGLSALLSVGFIPAFRAPLGSIPRAAWKPLGAGALFMGLQALFLVSTIARFGDATAVNVIYSGRGLWSVAAVWVVGHWFANTERHAGGRVLARRLIGAALMTAAIVLALLR
ncbi:DMT family transporter [soil metagenome]